MDRVVLKSVSLIMFMQLVGCGSLDSRSNYKNPDFSNLNPAPESMSPPTDASGTEVIDDTVVRTQADYHYSLGEALSLDEESDRAIEEFKLAAVYDPQSASVRLRLATEFLRKGQLTESMEQAEQARKLDPENTEVRIFLGGLYSAMKMHRQALEHYQYVMQRDPKNADVVLYAGAIYVELEQYDTAEAHFHKAAKIEDNESKYLAHYYLGKMRVSQGENHYAEAEKAFNDCLTDNPEFDEGVLALADLYRVKGQKARSIKLLESFEEKFGPVKSVAYQLSQIYLEAENYDKALIHLRALESFEPQNLNVKVKIALILIEQKKYDVAIEKLEEIVVFAPGSDKIRFYLAAVYEETNRYDLAIRNFNKIESVSTYYPDAIVHAAYLYRKKKELENAADLLKRAIATRNDVPQFYAFYASVLDEMKEFDKGVKMLEAATQKFPDNTQLRFYLGSMYDRIGRTKDTIAEMRKVLALDGDHVQALNYLAYTFAELGENLDEAEALAYKAMKLQPSDGFIIDTLGWVLFKRGRIEDAIQYLEAAYKLKPDESVIAEHLGDAYYVYELNDKARQMYLKAVNVESDQAKINKIRAKITSMDSRPQNRRPASVSGK